MESEVLHAILGIQHIDENADAWKIFEPLYLNVSDFRDVEFCFAFFCSLPSFKLIFKLLLCLISLKGAAVNKTIKERGCGICLGHNSVMQNRIQQRISFSTIVSMLTQK